MELLEGEATLERGPARPQEACRRAVSFSSVYLFHLLPFLAHFHFLQVVCPPLPAKLQAAAWGLSFPERSLPEVLAVLH